MDRNESQTVVWPRLTEKSPLESSVSFSNEWQDWCTAMGILLHFSFLSSFMWMGIEGSRLCRLVLLVFTPNDWTGTYVVVGYGVPTIIVAVTVLTAFFTTEISAAYCDDETYTLIFIRKVVLC